MKIRKNDNVIIVTGKDKGKTGKVLEVLTDREKVIVEGANIVKKHIRYRNSDKSGEIIERPAPIHVSNVMLVDAKTKKPTRVGYKIEGDKKIRISKKSGEKI